MPETTETVMKDITLHGYRFAAMPRMKCADMAVSPSKQHIEG